MRFLIIVTLFLSFIQSVYANTPQLRELVNYELNYNPGFSLVDRLRLAKYIVENATLNENLKSELCEVYKLTKEELEQTILAHKLDLNLLDGKVLKKVLTTPFSLSYLRVPEEYFEKFRVVSAIKNDPIFFEKEAGTTYFRLFHHPLQSDRAIERRIAELEKHNIDTTIHKLKNDFYFSSSRSLFYYDESEKMVKSIKMGVTKATGAFKDKSLTHKFAENLYERSKLMDFVAKKMGWEDSDFLPEPHFASMQTQSLDEGFIVRNYPDLKEGKRYIPFFTALNKEFSTKIALYNGFQDIDEFWRQNLLYPMADALSEIFLKTGFTYNSPHTQNFYLILDENFKPTLEIRTKDFDFFIDKNSPLLELKRFQKLKDITEFSSMVDEVHNPFMLINGLKEKPEWLDNISWARDFYKRFYNNVYKKVNLDSPSEIQLVKTYINKFLPGDFVQFPEGQDVPNYYEELPTHLKGAPKGFQKEYLDNPAFINWRKKISKKVGLHLEVFDKLMRENQELLQLLVSPDLGAKKILTLTSDDFKKVPLELLKFFNNYYYKLEEYNISSLIDRILKQANSIDGKLQKKLALFSEHFSINQVEIFLAKLDQKSHKLFPNQFLLKNLSFANNSYFAKLYFQNATNDSLENFITFILKSLDKNTSKSYSSWVPLLINRLTEDKNTSLLKNLINTKVLTENQKNHINNIIEQSISCSNRKITFLKEVKPKSNLNGI